MKKLASTLMCCAIFTVAGGQTSFVINASSTEGGTIVSEGVVTVERGTSKQFVLEPLPGFIIEHIEVDASPAVYSLEYNNQGAFGAYTFSDIQANHTIKVFFTKARKFLIHTYSDGEGSIVPSGNIFALPGEKSPVFTVTAASGYAIAQIIIDHAPVGMSGATDHFTYQFNNVMANHEIQAHFIAKEQ